MALTYVAKKTVRDCLVMIFLLSNDKTLLRRLLEVVVSFGNANLQIYFNSDIWVKGKTTGLFATILHCSSDLVAYQAYLRPRLILRSLKKLSNILKKEFVNFFLLIFPCNTWKTPTSSSLLKGQCAQYISNFLEHK